MSDNTQPITGFFGTVTGVRVTDSAEADAAAKLSNADLVGGPLPDDMRAELLAGGVDKTRVDDFWAAVQAFQNGEGDRPPLSYDYFEPLPDEKPGADVINLFEIRGVGGS